MPALFSARVGDFLVSWSDEAVLGRLSQVASAAGTQLAAEQMRAWREQLQLLRQALNSPRFQTWHLLLEYPLPRRGKRIDTVLLAEDLIVVLEFKCGARKFEASAVAQLEDYCLDLRDFHTRSWDRFIVPVLVATRAPAQPVSLPPLEGRIAPVIRSSGDNLAQLLAQVFRTYGATRPAIDPTTWENSPYLPTPTIIEAACALYEGQNVREITRCHAGAENLTKTSQAVLEVVDNARARGDKHICFATGVPGSGKTLAGLNIVHNRSLHEGELGVFLSGNGPLVRVLCEALARDYATRAKASIREARRHVSTFIQNVHRFIDQHENDQSPPADRVVVFDEAQRAWDKEQSYRKFRRQRSEPETMLSIMDRHEGWAVIVALVGLGQEINTGEAGLSEWIRVLADRFPHWRVHAPPDLSDDLEGISGDPASVNLAALHVDSNPDLHLEVCLRSFRAQAVSEFVDHLLSSRIDQARQSLAQCQDFPLLCTRDLEQARDWLRTRQKGFRRTGLVATSGARRLRAFGLDVRNPLEVEQWFLNPPWDVRSSCYLEVPATEFAVQGLELDWVGLCWDLDLVPHSGQWCVRDFRGTQWKKVNDPIRIRYVLNKYRVLLTRAREGMVIWVPPHQEGDPTRPGYLYDRIYDLLREAGVPPL